MRQGPTLAVRGEAPRGSGGPYPGRVKGLGFRVQGKTVVIFKKVKGLEFGVWVWSEPLY